MHRRVLFDQLNEGLNRKLILVSAPAGFGKSTLLSDWISQHKIPAAWFSVDKEDNDPAEFLSYIISGIQSIDAKVGQRALEILNSPNKPSSESIACLLINDVLALKKNFLLVLDDFHLINSIEIIELMTYLLEHIPDNLHIVISTRSDPALPLSRLRSQNQLLELRSSSLSFSANDISALFNKKLNIKLSIEDSYLLESKTEGWIAGLQLAAISLQGRDEVSEFITDFKGDNRYIMDYLIEEVLKIQSEDTKEFLLQTSILSQLSAPLCNAVLCRNDSQILLEKLDKNNMFVFPLDAERQWYRYHHLFADLLRQRLLLKDQSIVESLHNNAIAWFEENNMYELAIAHALKINSHDKSVHLIGQIVERMWENGHHSAILKYGDLLPEEAIKKNPEFCLYYGWILIVTGKIQKAESFLMSAEGLAKKRILDHSLPEDSLTLNKILLGRIAVAFALMYTITGRPDHILSYNEIARENLSEDKPLWYSWIWYTTGIAKLVLEKYSESIQDLTRALDYGKISGNIYLMTTIVSRLSFILHRLGHFKSAYRLCADLLSFMKQRGYSQIAKMDWTFASLFSNMAMVQSIWAEWDDALENIKIAYNLSKQEPNVLVKYVVLFGYSMVLQGRGDEDGAAAKIIEMDELLRNYKITPQQKSTYVAWKGYILINSGQHDNAYKFLKENGFGLEQEISYSNEHGYMPYANLLLTELKTREAEVLLSKLLKLAQDGNRIERMHELKIFYACLYKINGNRKEALNSLIESMEFATENEIIMYFILYLDKIDDLLQDAYKLVATTNTTISRRFMDKLIRAIEKSKESNTYPGETGLSARELDILVCIAEKLTNQETAEKLFISLNTVKTHVKNIFLKLEVDNRSEAVLKARELEII